MNGEPIPADHGAPLRCAARQSVEGLQAYSVDQCFGDSVFGFRVLGLRMVLNPCNL